MADQFGYRFADKLRIGFVHIRESQIWLITADQVSLFFNNGLINGCLLRFEHLLQLKSTGFIFGTLRNNFELFMS